MYFVTWFVMCYLRKGENAMTTEHVLKCVGCHRVFGCFHNDRNMDCGTCSETCLFVCCNSVSGGFCLACTWLKLGSIQVRKMLAFGC